MISRTKAESKADIDFVFRQKSYRDDSFNSERLKFLTRQRPMNNIQRGLKRQWCHGANSRTDGFFLEWSTKLWEVLHELFPLSGTMTPIPEDRLLPPRYTVAFASSNPPLSSNSSPLNSFPCKVKQNKRITAPGHWQDVRHIILESQNPTLAYEPGDIAVLYPSNPPEEVEAFLDTLHWTEIADEPLSITHALTSPLPYH